MRKELEAWTAPHSRAMVMVDDADGPVPREVSAVVGRRGPGRRATKYRQPSFNQHPERYDNGLIGMWTPPVGHWVGVVGWNPGADPFGPRYHREWAWGAQPAPTGLRALAPTRGNADRPPTSSFDADPG